MTMLLEQADPCVLGAVVRELESWAAADELVDVALVALHGAPGASLRWPDSRVIDTTGSVDKSLAGAVELVSLMPF